MSSRRRRHKRETRNSLGSVARTSEQQRPNTTENQASSGIRDEARHYQTQPCTVCKTSIPGSNPGASNPKFDPSTYDVQLLDSSLISRASSTGGATTENSTTLRTTLDIGAVSSGGAYQFAYGRRARTGNYFRRQFADALRSGPPNDRSRCAASLTECRAAWLDLNRHHRLNHLPYVYNNENG